MCSRLTTCTIPARQKRSLERSEAYHACFYEPEIHDLPRLIALCALHGCSLNQSRAQGGRIGNVLEEA